MASDGPGASCFCYILRFTKFVTQNSRLCRLGQRVASEAQSLSLSLLTVIGLNPCPRKWFTCRNDDSAHSLLSIYRRKYSNEKKRLLDVIHCNVFICGGNHQGVAGNIFLHDFVPDVILGSPLLKKQVQFLKIAY